MSNIHEVVATRRTVRRFQDKPIPENILIRLVQGARMAPSGSNLQPCEFILIHGLPEMMNSVFDCLKWAAAIEPFGNPPEGERPTAYVIVLVDLFKKKKHGEVDAAAAVENILLAAWAEGIGSCWLGNVERKKMKKLLKIPHHLNLEFVVALGYPNEKPVVDDIHGSVRYWKDESGILHVPKRTLQDVCFLNGYGKDQRLKI